MDIKDQIHAPEEYTHWQLLRDVTVFQIKLAMDGLRDVLLSPVSIAAAIWGMIASPSNPGTYFQRLLQLGRESDGWINLFGDVGQSRNGGRSVDKYAHQVQDLMSNQYQKGGVIKKAKDNTDSFLECFRNK